MRIVCPSCRATYEVPDRILAGPARSVRCARCGTEWSAIAAEEEEASFAQDAARTLQVRQTAAARPLELPPATTGPEPWPPVPSMPESIAAPPSPVPERAERKLSGYRPRGGASEDDERLPPRDYESPPSRRGVVVGWALTLLLLAVIGWGAVSYRAQVMTAWPPSERVYAALGLR